MKKDAVKKTGLDPVLKDYRSSFGDLAKASNRGVGCSKLLEPVPNYIEAACEKIIAAENNTWIILGRDRPSSRNSGYGGRGDTGAGSIDIVVGRMGYDPSNTDEEGNKLFTDPNLKTDSARVLVSQKTDVDKNFGLARGKVGVSKAKSSVALKADAVRIIAREGIKLVTKTDVRNSHGAKIEEISGIDLIAGNIDKELQPLVKGGNAVEALERLIHHVDKLNGIVDSFLTTQMDFNESLTHHTHISPFYGQPTMPSFAVQAKGVKTMISNLVQTKASLMAHKVNLQNYKFKFLSEAGTKYINSRYNNSN